MPRVLRVLRAGALLAVVGFAGVTALSYCGRFHWLPELITHFRGQLALVGLGLLLVSAGLRLGGASAIAAVALGAHVLPLAPYLVPRPAAGPASAAPLRLLLANVHTGNPDHDRVRRLILETRPDLLGLLEVDEAWLTALGDLEGRYPHRIQRPQDDNFGIALFSRYPLERTEIRSLEHEGVPAIVAHLQLGDRPTVIALAHPVPPVGGHYSALRNRQLAALGRMRREFGDREFVVLGDLNAAPWSPHYRALEATSGLRNAALGRGVLATWPTRWPWLGIPIDHCLVSAGLRVVSLRRGPPIGSDHLPLLVELEPSPAPPVGDAQPARLRSRGMS